MVKLTQPNVFDVGPTLYKCYRNDLCLVGMCTCRVLAWMSMDLAVDPHPGEMLCTGFWCCCVTVCIAGCISGSRRSDEKRTPCR